MLGLSLVGYIDFLPRRISLQMMNAGYKPSISSRASVRSLVVACMPAAAVGLLANSPALGAAFIQVDQGLAVNDNNGASTNGSSTNGSARTTNDISIQGIRG
jgi:hypothetical protein